MPSSRSCFAVPNIVWTTSCVEISRERPSRIPGLDHRLGEQREIGRAGAGDRGDGIHRALGHADDRAEVEQRLLRQAKVLFAGVRACADAGHALVDGRGRVRHRPHDRNAGPSDRSTTAVGIAAAIVSTVCSGEIRPPTSPRRTSRSCGFTAITTSAAPLAASAFESVVRMR